MALPAPDPASRLRAARKALHERGTVAAKLLSPGLARSWQRCRDAGLVPAMVPGDAALQHGAGLRQALEQQRDFLAQARPVLAFVHDQIREGGGLVVLADGNGLLLHSVGEPDFVARAERVSLMPGACWSEHQRGTNAIGTALAEAAACVVHAGEHFLDLNGFLTCASAPIVDSAGRVRGVVDISGDYRSRHPHTLALVRTAACMIEDRLFSAAHSRHVRLHLHPVAEALGTVGEGLLALTEDGWVVGGNAQARAWFGLGERDFGACTTASVLGIAPNELLASAGRLRRLELPGARLVWARVELPPAPLVVAVAAPASTPTANDRDPHVADARNRAERALRAGLPLLLQGESGTGKDVFARELHAAGPRRQGPFVAVNCAAIPEPLVEAELFGYCPGAFTGARREGSLGRFREADRGTLFLDEIGDMPLGLQTRLLRVLEERRVMPLGASTTVPVDVQIICATHCDLPRAVARGEFRADLFHRLAGLSVTLPPLRARTDFESLCAVMLQQVRPGQITTLAPGLRESLRDFDWPGNLRQLRHVLTAAAVMLDPGETRIEWQHLPEAVRERPAAARPSDAESEANLARLSARTMVTVVEATGHNLSEAARRLGISRNTLYRRLRALRDGRELGEETL